MEFALCGSYSKDYDPYAVTADTVTQQVLLAINSEPLSLQKIVAETNIGEQEAIQCLKALERCRLIKEIRKTSELCYKPSFTIFSLHDQEKLRPLVEKLSESLVRVVKDLLPKIREELENIECVRAGYHFPDLEYIAIGAYTLDYGGLEFLKEEGLLLVSKEMPGGNYVFAGFEAGLVNLREAWMWGHNGEYGRYTFSTHGKLPPKGRRRAFPDLGRVWTYCAENEEEEKNIEQRIVSYGDLLYGLLSRPATLDDLVRTLNRRKFDLIFDLTFLEELEYVVSSVEHGNPLKYALKRPVLPLKDYKRIREPGRRILLQFLSHLKASHDELESSYRATSPSQNGIDMREAFNSIYHIIFEKALDKLMVAGIIEKPPLRKDGGRYSPWVAIERST